MAFSTAAIADQHSGVKTEHGKWIEAVKATGVFFNARYRYEHVEDKGFTRRANANTLQTHLGYKSNIHHGVSGLIEVENVHAAGGQRLQQHHQWSGRFPDRGGSGKYRA